MIRNKNLKSFFVGEFLDGCSNILKEHEQHVLREIHEKLAPVQSKPLHLFGSPQIHELASTTITSPRISPTTKLRVSSSSETSYK